MERQKAIFFIIIAFYITSVSSQKHKIMSLNLPYHQQLNRSTFFNGRYVFNISQSQKDIPNNSIWYFFVEVQPQEDQEWKNTQIVLSKSNKDQEQISTVIRNCKVFKGGVDSCFLSSSQFSYQNEIVHAKVSCRGPCKFNISASIESPRKLMVGENTTINPNNTASSKIFNLQSPGNNKNGELRIILRPITYLSFPAPINLYVNHNTVLPTKQRYDYKGMTLWNEGLGVFIDAKTSNGVYTILVQSPERNILILEAIFVSQESHQNLTINQPFDDHLKINSKRSYILSINPLLGISIQLTLFSGEAKIQRFEDQNGIKIQSQLQQSKRLYGENEYIITPAILTKLKNKYKIVNSIIIKIEAFKSSTFVISYHNFNQSTMQLVPQRNRYMEIQPNTINQYYIELNMLDLAQNKIAQFQIIFKKAKKLQINFYSCTTLDVSTCQATLNLKQNQPIKNDNLTKILDFGVQFFKFHDDMLGYYFSFKQFDFKKNQNGQKKYLFMIVVLNPMNETKLYSTQYINYGKNVYLRQKQVKNDRVLLNQSKYYSFTNRDNDVQTIRIHVMEISGSVISEGYLEDPRDHNNKNIKALASYRNSINYQRLKPGKTIYLKITGLESSHYTVQLQLIKGRQQQLSWWNRTKQQQKAGYNEILLSHNIPYQFSIQSKSKEVYQIHPNQTNFLLEISSSLVIQFCLTENLKQPPFKPNCQLSRMIKNEIFNISLLNGSKANIGIYNNQSKQIKLKIKYRYQNIVDSSQVNSNSSNSNNSINSDVRCLPGVFNHINEYKFLKGMASCYSFFPQQYDEFQFTIDVISQQYNAVSINIQINKIQKIAILGAKHIFSKEEVEKVCKGSKPFCPFIIFISSQVDTQILFALQYTNKPFFLLDGLAHQFTGVRQSKNFIFDLYTKTNTTIILENKIGTYKFYGNIVQSADYYRNKTYFPSNKNKIIESTNPFFNKYEIFILNETKIHQFNCTQCLLLLTVIRVKQFLMQQSGKFLIQCTQQDRFIKQRVSVVSFISKDSLQFYQYYNKEKGLILVTLNSQNKWCVNMHMIKGIESRASSQNRDRSSQNANKNILIYNDAEIGSYSLTLQGYENCFYSLDITSSSQNFRTVQKGLIKDLYLQKDKIIKFVYENKDNQTIKILTLHENGQILINVKSYKNLKQITQDNSKKISYTWTGRDFLNIDKKDKKYCSDCVYLIVIRAERQTRSSILIPTQQSQFPLIVDSSIKDQLKKGEKEKLKIFSEKKIIFEINVLYGSIKIQKFKMNNDTAQFSKIYDAKNSTQYEEMSQPLQNRSNDIYGYYVTYSIIIIEALNDSSFSFGLISDKDTHKRGFNVKYGIPQYVMLDQNKKHCLYGVLDDHSEQFLISITGQQQKQIMKDIVLTCNVQGEYLNLTKKIAINQMLVTIQGSPKKLPKQYEFCFLSTKSVYLTFIQSSKLNYLDEKKRLFVNKEINLTFYSLGTTLIQLNECTSRAIATISPSLSTIDSFNSEIQQIRKSNNIIQFLYYGPIFMNIKAQGATLSWRQKNMATGQGQGYDQYSVDRFRLNKADDDYLQIQIYPLKKRVLKNKVSFKSIDYTAYIAEQEIYLYNAINCNNGQYISQSKSVTGRQVHNVITIKILVRDILQKFKDKKYLLITVLAIAQSTIINDANYRFIYNYMQFPISSLRKIEIQQQPPTYIQNLMYRYIVYLMVLFILFFGGAWIYKKCIRKIKKQQLNDKDSKSSDIKYQQFSSQT